MVASGFRCTSVITRSMLIQRSCLQPLTGWWRGCRRDQVEFPARAVRGAGIADLRRGSSQRAVGAVLFGAGFLPPPRPRAPLVDRAVGLPLGAVRPGVGVITTCSRGDPPALRAGVSAASSAGSLLSSADGAALSASARCSQWITGRQGSRMTMRLSPNAGSCSSHPAAAAATTAETRVAVDVVAPPVSTRRLSSSVVGRKDLVSAGRVPASGVAAGVSVSSSSAARRRSLRVVCGSPRRRG